MEPEYKGVGRKGVYQASQRLPLTEDELWDDLIDYLNKEKIQEEIYMYEKVGIQKDELDLFHSLIKFISIGIISCIVIGTIIFLLLP